MADGVEISYQIHFELAKLTELVWVLTFVCGVSYLCFKPVLLVLKVHVFTR